MIQYMDQIREILKTPIPISIVTTGESGAHLVGVWNDDIFIASEDTILIPVMGMRKTEVNIKSGSDVALLIASKEVKSPDGGAMGFRVTGSGVFYYSGRQYEFIKSKLDWARAALGISITKIERLI